MFLLRADIARIKDQQVAGHGCNAAEKDWEEHEACDTRTETMAEGEDNGVCLKQQIHAAVDELQHPV